MNRRSGGDQPRGRGAGTTARSRVGHAPASRARPDPESGEARRTASGHREAAPLAAVRGTPGGRGPGSRGSRRRDPDRDARRRLEPGPPSRLGTCGQPARRERRVRRGSRPRGSQQFGEAYAARSGSGEAGRLAAVRGSPRRRGSGSGKPPASRAGSGKPPARRDRASRRLAAVRGSPRPRSGSGKPAGRVPAGPARVRGGTIGTSHRKRPAPAAPEFRDTSRTGGQGDRRRPHVAAGRAGQARRRGQGQGRCATRRRRHAEAGPATATRSGVGARRDPAPRRHPRRPPVPGHGRGVRGLRRGARARRRPHAAPAGEGDAGRAVGARAPRPRRSTGPASTRPRPSSSRRTWRSPARSTSTPC